MTSHELSAILTRLGVPAASQGLIILDYCLRSGDLSDPYVWKQTYRLAYEVGRLERGRRDGSC